MTYFIHTTDVVEVEESPVTLYELSKSVNSILLDGDDLDDIEFE